MNMVFGIKSREIGATIDGVPIYTLEEMRETAKNPAPTEPPPAPKPYYNPLFFDKQGNRKK